VLYSKTSQLKTGARLNYSYHNKLNIQLKGAYNYWKTYDTEEAWQLPKYEADFDFNALITEDVSISANAFFRSERKALIADKILSMKPVVDLNVGAAYSYSTWLSFFVKANNLLNSKYQLHYGYDVQGFNAMLGAVLSF
jgi:outer membrane cobalamin receptor